MLPMFLMLLMLLMFSMLQILLMLLIFLMLPMFLMLLIFLKIALVLHCWRCFFRFLRQRLWAPSWTRTSVAPRKADSRSLTLALDCNVSFPSFFFVFLGFSLKLLDRSVGYI